MALDDTQRPANLARVFMWFTVIYVGMVLLAIGAVFLSKQNLVGVWLVLLSVPWVFWLPSPQTHTALGGVVGLLPSVAINVCILLTIRYCIRRSAS